MTRVLITGGCGFVGHHVVEHILKNTNWDIFILDKLSYASHGLDRLRDIKAFDDDRVSVFSWDLHLPISEGVLRETKNINYIIHLAAETHVDNSIKDPISFVQSNVLGTTHTLNYARKLPNLKAFVYFSTDEVFGPAPEGIFYKEWDRYDSTNPYSASKAGGEEMALAFANTYKFPLFITHTMNVFGERQYGEKFIPLCIRKILNGETITIHSDKTCTKSGTRFYIHARNVASAILFLLNKFNQRDKYNIVGEKEVSNLQLAQMIADILDKPLNYKMVDFHSSRPGHDLRYALDGGKMKKLGWNPNISMEESLEKVVFWTLENPQWL